MRAVPASVSLSSGLAHPACCLHPVHGSKCRDRPPPPPAPPTKALAPLSSLLVSPSGQVLHDCQRYRSNIREIGDLWVGAGSGHGGLSALPATPPGKSTAILLGTQARGGNRAPAVVPPASSSQHS